MRIDWLPVVLQSVSRKSMQWLNRSPQPRHRRVASVGSVEGLEDRALMSNKSLLGDLLPIGTPDVFTGLQDTPLASVTSILDNDTGLLGGLLTSVLATAPTHGVLDLLPDGTFSYLPDPGFVGTDTFSYFTNDGLLGSLLPSLVTLDILPALPVGVPDAFTVLQDTPLNSVTSILSNDTGPLGSVLTSVLATAPTHGVLNLLPDGTFSYIPDLGFVGTDTFSYFTNDGLLGSLLPSLVSLDILPTNQPPVAVNDVFNVQEDATFDISLGTALDGVLANDTDSDILGLPDILGLGDVVLTANLVTSTSHGSLLFLPTGTFIYTPDPDFTGIDTFTYQASDLLSQSNVATVTFNVVAVNDPPVSAGDSYSIGVGSSLNVTAANGVLANDIDVDSANLTASLVTGPAFGALTLNADGSFAYTPGPLFVGVDVFTYVASDGTAFGNLATVLITVTGTVNNVPVAANDAYAVTEDTLFATTLANGVLLNDADADADPLTAILVSGPSHGAVTLNPNGTFSYTPNANYTGTDSFSYQANDGKSNSNIATVLLTISGVNDAPISVADAYSTDENVALTVAASGVLSNDSDPEGNSLSAVLVTGPTHGSLTLNANGSFTYTPDAGFTGVDSFSYRANDGTQNGNTVAVSLTVEGVNSLPVLTADTYGVAEDSVLTVGAATGVLANDSDEDGDPLTAILVTSTTHGTLTLNADGSLVYTPNPDFSGTDSFTYRANDGTASGSAVVVTINVAAADEAPVITTSVGGKTVRGKKRTVIDGAVNLVDPDSPNFGGGHLDIAITSGAGSKDVIGYKKAGANKGRVNAKHGQVRIGRVVIGTISGGRNGTAAHIEFNSNATQQRVEAIMQNAGFRGRRSEAGPRVISYQVTDETGLTSNVATKNIDVV